MSYYASGSGMVIPNKEKQIPDDVLEMVTNQFSEVADSPDGGWWMTKEYDTLGDMDGAMKALAPFVVSGEVEMTGEDFQHWRYRFWNGKVYIENGEVAYEQERRTFNVDYYDPDGESDQTQFDIEGGDFATMFNELIGLFAQFCGENYGSAQGMCEITGIEEVPYDGDVE